jgi:hypothetical protein
MYLHFSWGSNIGVMFLYNIKNTNLKPLCKDFTSNTFKNPCVIMYRVQNGNTLSIMLTLQWKISTWYSHCIKLNTICNSNVITFMELSMGNFMSNVYLGETNFGANNF